MEARLIAEILPRGQGPASPVPTADVPGLRDLTRLRTDRVAHIGDVKRRISSLVDRPFPACATCVTDVCGQAARTRLETWTLPEPLAAVPTAQRAALLARLSHGHCGAEQARAVNAAAPQSLGGTRAAEARAFARRVLRRQIREREGLVAEWARESHRR